VREEKKCRKRMRGTPLLGGAATKLWVVGLERRAWIEKRLLGRGGLSLTGSAGYEMAEAAGWWQTDS
jgi:hypothetical protein